MKKNIIIMLMVSLLTGCATTTGLVVKDNAKPVVDLVRDCDNQAPLLIKSLTHSLDDYDIDRNDLMNIGLTLITQYYAGNLNLHTLDVESKEYLKKCAEKIIQPMSIPDQTEPSKNLALK